MWETLRLFIGQPTPPRPRTGSDVTLRGAVRRGRDGGKRAAWRKSSARRALHKAELDEIGLDDVFDCVAGLGQSGGDRLDADRTAAELDGDRVEITPIHLIKPDRVHVEQLERPVGKRARHALRAFDHGEVAHASKQAPGDAGRAARAFGDLVRAVIGKDEADHSGAARDNALQLFGGVKIEADRNAEIGRATGW